MPRTATVLMAALLLCVPIVAPTATANVDHRRGFPCILTGEIQTEGNATNPTIIVYERLSCDFD